MATCCTITRIASIAVIIITILAMGIGRSLLQQPLRLPVGLLLKSLALLLPGQCLQPTHLRRPWHRWDGKDNTPTVLGPTATGKVWHRLITDRSIVHGELFTGVDGTLGGED